MRFASAKHFSRRQTQRAQACAIGLRLWQRVTVRKRPRVPLVLLYRVRVHRLNACF